MVAAPGVLNLLWKGFRSWKKVCKIKILISAFSSRTQQKSFPTQLRYRAPKALSLRDSLKRKPPKPNWMLGFDSSINEVLMDWGSGEGKLLTKTPSKMLLDKQFQLIELNGGNVFAKNSTFPFRWRNSDCSLEARRNFSLWNFLSNHDAKSLIKSIPRTWALCSRATHARPPAAQPSL